MRIEPVDVPGLSAQPPLTEAEMESVATPRSARRDFLLFSPPSIGQEEIEEVVAALRSGWITTGPRTHKFEGEFAARVGAQAALGLNSCTAGLHTALVAAGVGPGDEVVTSPMTFAATINVIEHVGATPVLADIEVDTLNLRPSAVEAVLSPRTRAIIPVHYAGHPADLDPLQDLADRAGAILLEDAAHALIASYRGRTIGSGSNPVSFSFYATKNLTTGEGGMLTGTPEFLDRARVLSLHGMSRDAWRRYAKGGNWRYDIVAPGFKYNMTDVQAAMGLAQLRKLSRFQQRREEIAERYSTAFRDLDTIDVPVPRPDVEPAWHLYVVRLNPDALRIDRDQFIDELTTRNIGTSVHFIPAHRHSYYRHRYGLTAADFPVAEDSFQRILSLPLHPGLTEADVSDVIEAVWDIDRTFRR